MLLDMAKRKKNKSLPTRTKRMKRSQRLQSTKRWLNKFQGENVIRAYRKRYSVDWLSAIKELRILGVELDSIYVNKLQQTIEGKIKENHRSKLGKQKEDELLNNRYPDSDENFYFIAVYTSGGMPYGITWEEAEKEGLLEDEE